MQLTMNEHILSLAERAAYETRKKHNNPYWRIQDEISEDVTWREKFAELIIQECIQVAIKAVSVDEENEAWYLIQQHFGVNE